MKPVHFIIFSCFILLTRNSSAQGDFNKISIDLNLGVNSAMGPFAEGYSSNYLGVGHVDLGGRYMLSEHFGFKLDFGFDQINNDQSGHIENDGGFAGVASKEFRVHYVRTSLQMYFNIGHVFQLQELHPRFGMMAHFGAGFSSLKSVENSVWFQYWKTQGTDEMMNFPLGLTGQLKMTDKLALHMDFTMVANAWSSKTWDFTEEYFRKGLTTKLFNWSIGASYYIGSKSRHADWLSATRNGPSI